MVYAIDHRGRWDNILNDLSRVIPESHLISICKIHKGKLTCKYIAKSPNGSFVCVKKSRINKVVDRIANVQGDNCEGIGEGEKENTQEIDKSPS